MKRILPFFAFVFCVSVCSAQSKAGYLQKSKRQKTAAWICLAGGTGLSVIGLSQINVAGSDNGTVNNTPGTVLFATGAAAAITSIPLFIAASNNKKKATTVAFNNIKVYNLNSGGIVSSNQVPAVSLQFSF